MESTIRETGDVKREIDITLGKTEVDPYFDKIYKTAQQRVQLKGFRKGMVPLSLIKKMYGTSLESDALEEAVQTAFGKYAEEHHLHPIGTPIVTRIDRTEDGGVNFTIAYEVLPEFQLGEYKGLQATRIYHIVSEEEIQSEIDRIRENFMTQEPAEQVEDENFVVTVDLQRMENGEPVEDAVSEGVQIYLRRQAVNSELKSSLLNTRVGDTFTVDLPTGEEESMMTYQVSVRDIKRAVLPELDDEFARKVTGEEESTPQDVIDLVKQTIEAEYERRYSHNFRDELISRLIETHRFDVPQELVRQVLQSFLEDMKQGPKKELPKGFDQQKFVEQMLPVAERTARWALIRDQIIKKEELKADEADYEGLAQMEAGRTGIDYETLLKYFKQAPATADRILAEKAIQFLEDYAIVNEVEDLDIAPQESTAPEEG
jgi:trigger factor